MIASLALFSTYSCLECQKREDGETGRRFSFLFHLYLLFPSLLCLIFFFKEEDEDDKTWNPHFSPLSFSLSKLSHQQKKLWKREREDHKLCLFVVVTLDNRTQTQTHTDRLLTCFAVNNSSKAKSNKNKNEWAHFPDAFFPLPSFFMFLPWEVDFLIRWENIKMWKKGVNCRLLPPPPPPTFHLAVVTFCKGICTKLSHSLKKQPKIWEKTLPSTFFFLFCSKTAVTDIMI